MWAFFNTRSDFHMEKAADHFYSQWEFNFKNVHLFLSHLKELNEWIKNHVKSTPKKSFVWKI